MTSTPESTEPTGPTDLTGRLARFRADLNQVRDGYDRFGLFDDRVRIVQGSYGASLPDAPIGDVAVLRSLQCSSSSNTIQSSSSRSSSSTI